MAVNPAALSQWCKKVTVNSGLVMAKMSVFARVLNGLLIVIMLAVIPQFVAQFSLYGFFLALVSCVIAWGIFRRNRWAYFCAAAWGLAWFQLAKQGLEFANFKREAMILGVLVIPLALFLHETLAKKSTKEAQNDSENDSSGRNMPQ